MIKLLTIAMVSAVTGGHHHHHHCKPTHHHKCKVHHAIRQSPNAHTPAHGAIPRVEVKAPQGNTGSTPITQKQSEEPQTKGNESREEEWPQHEVTCAEWEQNMREAEFEQEEIEELSMC